MREYVKVEANFMANGDVFPKAFTVGAARRYPITAIADILHSPGKQCSIYSVCVDGEQISIYREGDRWFVERM